MLPVQCAKIDFRKLKTKQTYLKILCKWSIYNFSTLPNELENIHFKETDIFRIRCVDLKLLLNHFPNFGTCTYNKLKFFSVFDYTGSAMKNSACNFRQKLNDFWNQVFCFKERKVLEAPNHKDYIFLENFAVFSLAMSISVCKIFCFVLSCVCFVLFLFCYVLFCSIKGNRKAFSWSI